MWINLFILVDVVGIIVVNDDYDNDDQDESAEL